MQLAGIDPLFVSFTSILPLQTRRRGGKIVSAHVETFSSRGELEFYSLGIEQFIAK
jgi:hypothetical protein